MNTKRMQHIRNVKQVAQRNGAPKAGCVFLNDNNILLGTLFIGKSGAEIWHYDLYWEKADLKTARLDHARALKEAFKKEIEVIAGRP